MSISPKSPYFTTPLVFNSPWVDLREIFSGSQRMAKVSNAVEILPKIFEPFGHNTRVTDDSRQTDRQTDRRQRMTIAECCIATVG